MPAASSRSRVVPQGAPTPEKSGRLPSQLGLPDARIAERVKIQRVALRIKSSSVNQQCRANIAFVDTSGARLSEAKVTRNPASRHDSRAERGENWRRHDATGASSLHQDAV
jgi:hypothetical protein